MDLNFADIFNGKWKETGNINVLVAGRSGVGKGTLINAIFGQRLTEVGQGRPVTKTTKEITREGIPLTLFDTRGLEMEDFESTLDSLKELIHERKSDQDPNRHLHVAWVCIHEDGRRVEDAETKLVNMIAGEDVPVIVVITKARQDNGFKNEVIKLIPNARNVVRVRAIQDTFDEGFTLPKMGLDTLVEATSEVIPEGKRNAFASAQIASLEYKKLQSRVAVAVAGTAAAGAAFTPIPFSDAAILAPIQIGMIAKISIVFGIDLTGNSLKMIVTSALSVVGASFLGRAIVANVIKFLPGVGSLMGGALNAATALAVTNILGEVYIRVMAELYQEDPELNFDPEEIAKRFKEHLQKNKLSKK